MTDSPKTLRDEFAMAAMRCLPTNPQLLGGLTSMASLPLSVDGNRIAYVAYGIANAMMRQRTEEEAV
jgi:hypothetical protein